MAVPGSVLLLKGNYFQDEAMKNFFLETFLEAAVDPSAPGYNFKSKNKVCLCLVPRRVACICDFAYSGGETIDVGSVSGRSVWYKILNCLAGRSGTKF